MACHINTEGRGQLTMYGSGVDGAQSFTKLEKILSPKSYFEDKVLLSSDNIALSPGKKRMMEFLNKHKK